jgi:hypothetical protein
MIVGGSEDQVKVVVVTDRPLQPLDKSFCVDHVYLRFRVDPTKITGDQDSKYKYPRTKLLFDGLDRNYISCPASVTGYCSEWSINTADSLNYDRHYEYKLAVGSTVYLQLGGGSMVGCALHSNIYALKYPM